MRRDVDILVDLRETITAARPTDPGSQQKLIDEINEFRLSPNDWTRHAGHAEIDALRSDLLGSASALVRSLQTGDMGQREEVLQVIYTLLHLIGRPAS
jgi:hypothetical protein